MENKTNKVKEFVKKHKVAIAVGVGTTIVVAGYLYTKSKGVKDVQLLDCLNVRTPGSEFRKIPATMELGALGITEVDVYSGAIEVIGDYTLKVSDLGKLGEALSTVEGIGGDNKVYIMANVAKDVEDKLGTITATINNINVPS